jgi:hypothetical protein
VDFTSLNLFGTPLQHVETYVDYDGPRTFSMRSAAWPIYYIFNAVDEDEAAGSLTFLAVAVTESRFRATRSGLITFRDAFAGAGTGAVTLVTWVTSDDGRSVVLEPISEIPPEWLPVPGARLNLKTVTTKAFDARDLVHLSEAQDRTIFALEVESANSNITEFPTRFSGALQLAIHGEVEALAQESTSSRNSPAVRTFSTNVIELQAASFVIVFGVENSATLAEQTELTTEVFEKLGALVSAAGAEDTDGFLDEMRKHGPRVRNRFLDILDPLVKTGSGLALTTAVAYEHKSTRASASASAVKSAAESIANVRPTITYVEVKRGVLMGLNVRTKAFELVDAVSETRYHGHMSEEARTEADGFPVGNSSYVYARIRVETRFAADDDTSGIQYFVESIRELGEQGVTLPS